MSKRKLILPLLLLLSFSVLKAGVVDKVSARQVTWTPASGSGDVQLPFGGISNWNYIIEDNDINLSSQDVTYVENNCWGQINLAIDWDRNYCNDYPYSAEVIVTFDWTDINHNVYTNQSCTLHVEHFPGEKDRVRVKDNFVLPNAIRIRATSVSSITVKDISSGTPVTVSLQPQNIVLTVSLHTEKYKKLGSPSFSPTLNSNFMFSWSHITGAEEYEVEWLHVSGYASGNTYDFKNNSSRVVLPGNVTKYEIPSVYGVGRLFARVRAVGREPSNPSIKTYSVWSMPSSGSLNSGLQIAIGQNFEFLKNWNYNIAFDEHGRKGEAISYFDGTLRSRQSLSRNYSFDNRLVVNSKVYDFYGRLGAEFLPSIDETGTDLSFRSWYNQPEPHGVGFHPKEYTWDDLFIFKQGCIESTVGLLDDFGTERYYSSKNNLSGSFKALLPKSNKYPLYRFKYLGDNTGTVSRSTLPGPDHDFGSGHESKFMRSDYTGSTLTKLFGNQISSTGTNYFIERRDDPNGSIYYTYRNSSGQVIATSMGGDPPSQFVSTTPNPIFTNFSKDADIGQSQYNTVDVDLFQDKGCVTAVYNFVPTVSSTFNIDYTVDVPDYSDDCMKIDWCLECVYSFDLKIERTCNLPDGIATWEDITPSNLAQTVGTIDYTCNGNSSAFARTVNNIASFQIPIDKSYKYRITKVLCVDKSAAEQYADQYITNIDESCLTGTSEYLDNLIPSIDFSGCANTCQECLTALGPYSNYSDASKKNLPSYVYLSQAQYDQLVEKCNGLCTPPIDISPCEALLQEMKAQMTPGGQYAPFNTDGDPNSGFKQVPFSIFYNQTSGAPSAMIIKYNDPSLNYEGEDGGATVYIDGADVDIHNLTPEQFAQLLPTYPQWIEELVAHHPERCRYKYCIANEQSYLFDQSLEKIQDYQTALADGFINPLDNSSPPIPSVLNINANTSNKDPYFFATPSHSGLSQMISSISNVKDMNGNATGQSIWQAAFKILPSGYALSNNGWNTFKQLYLQEKQTFYDQDILALPNSTYSDCPSWVSDLNDGVLTVGTNNYPLTSLFYTESTLSQAIQDIGASSSDPNDVYDQLQNIGTQNAQQNCDNYIEFWKASFLQCGLPQAAVDILADDLSQICKCSASTSYPGGTTVCPTGSTYGDKTFEEAINRVFKQYNISWSDVCNPYMFSGTIEPPTGSFHHSLAEIDNCACEQIIETHKAYLDLVKENTLPQGINSENDYFLDRLKMPFDQSILVGCGFEQDELNCESISDFYKAYLDQKGLPSTYPYSQIDFNDFAIFVNSHLGVPISARKMFVIMRDCYPPVSSDISCETFVTYYNGFSEKYPDNTDLTLTENRAGFESYLKKYFGLSIDASQITNLYTNCILNSGSGSEGQSNPKVHTFHYVVDHLETVLTHAFQNEVGVNTSLPSTVDPYIFTDMDILSNLASGYEVRPFVKNKYRKVFWNESSEIVASWKRKYLPGNIGTLDYTVKNTSSQTQEFHVKMFAVTGVGNTASLISDTIIVINSDSAQALTGAFLPNTTDSILDVFFTVSIDSSTTEDTSLHVTSMITNNMSARNGEFDVYIKGINHFIAPIRLSYNSGNSDFRWRDVIDIVSISPAPMNEQTGDIYNFELIAKLENQSRIKLTGTTYFAIGEQLTDAEKKNRARLLLLNKISLQEQINRNSNNPSILDIVDYLSNEKMLDAIYSVPMRMKARTEVNSHFNTSFSISEFGQILNKIKERSSVGQEAVLDVNISSGIVDFLSELKGKGNLYTGTIDGANVNTLYNPYLYSAIGYNENGEYQMNQSCPLHVTNTIAQLHFPDPRPVTIQESHTFYVDSVTTDSLIFQFESPSVYHGGVAQVINANIHTSTSNTVAVNVSNLNHLLSMNTYSAVRDSVDSTLVHFSATFVADTLFDTATYTVALVVNGNEVTTFTFPLYKWDEKHYESSLAFTLSDECNFISKINVTKPSNLNIAWEDIADFITARKHPTDVYYDPARTNEMEIVAQTTQGSLVMLKANVEGYQLMMSGTQPQELPAVLVPSELTCDPCVSCVEIHEWLNKYRDYLRSNNQAVLLNDAEKFNVAFTQYVNYSYDYDFSPDDISTFLSRCDATKVVQPSIEFTKVKNLVNVLEQYWTPTSAPRDSVPLVSAEAESPVSYLLQNYPNNNNVTRSISSFPSALVNAIQATGYPFEPIACNMTFSKAWGNLYNSKGLAYIIKDECGIDGGAGEVGLPLLSDNDFNPDAFRAIMEPYGTDTITDGENLFEVPSAMASYDGLNPSGHRVAIPFINISEAFSISYDPDLRLCNPTIQPPPTPDGCITNLLINAQHQAYEQYTQQFADKREEFIDHYIEFCAREVHEEIPTHYDDKEYQFTLYYYDRAGNLVKTVPPQGVDKTGATAHTMATGYTYNTLGQVVAEKNPDITNPTRFYYDETGRLVLSESARQQEIIPTNKKRCSYTLYDEFGRVIQVGQLLYDQSVILKNVSATYTSFLSFVNDPANTRSEVTRTYYDEPHWAVPNLNQEFLRNRVASVTFAEYYNAQEKYDHAIHYSYDEHGHVNNMVQEFPGLQSYNRRYFYLNYDYDLLSGNVNKVTYQASKPDQLIHRYEYDANGRIAYVETSTDGITWQRDAQYEYYPHGPLQREMLGQLGVQGLDYYYTIHGWLKGINTPSLNPTHDAGKDGEALTVGNYTSPRVARDAMGFTIGYFNAITNGSHNDYEPIGSFTPEPEHGSGDYLTLAQAGPLYNGNINRLSYGQMKPDQTQLDPMANFYRYDYLNRLASKEVVTTTPALMAAAHDWGSNTVSNLYKEQYEYDANGNITRLKRNGGDPSKPEMDDLTYSYAAGSVNNRLRAVTEPTAIAGNYTQDIDNQTDPDNYTYDPSGNLQTDAAEHISYIDWSAYGKVKAVYKNNSDPNQFYYYNALGQRVMKESRAKIGCVAGTPCGQRSYYVHDATGNVLAVYNLSANNSGLVTLKLKERHLYGSSRVGMLATEQTIEQNTADVPLTPSDGSGSLLYPLYTGPSGGTTTPSISANNLPEYFGDRRYELSDHLGNVRNVITDLKISECKSDASQHWVEHYKPDVLATNDYYSFGMLVPDRTLQSDKYRYGFNGKEKEDEIKGEGNSLDFGARIFDARLARWFAVDPLISKYAEYSPYNYCINNPLLYLDPDGERINIYYKDADGKLVFYQYQSGLKVPDNKYVKQVIKTLDKITKKGHDPFDVIGFLANSTTANVGIYLPKPDNPDEIRGGATITIEAGVSQVLGSQQKSKMENQETPIIWHPKAGYISKDLKSRQSPANALLHELSHKYYAVKDIDGCTSAESNALMGSQKELDDFYNDQEYNVGHYNTYSDKWIIENIEPHFREGLRTNHDEGYILKVKGGTFSRRGKEVAKGEKKGVIKNTSEGKKIQWNGTWSGAGKR